MSKISLRSAMPAIAVVGFAAMAAIASPNAARAAAVEQPAIVLPAAVGAPVAVDPVSEHGETPIVLAAVQKVIRSNGSGGAGTNTGNKGGGTLRGTGGGGGGNQAGQGGNKGGNKGGASNNQGGGANQAALGGKGGKGGKGNKGGNNQGGGTQTSNAGGTGQSQSGKGNKANKGGNNQGGGTQTSNAGGTGQSQSGKGGKGSKKGGPNQGGGTQTGNAAGGTGQSQGGNQGGPNNQGGKKGKGGKGQGGIAQGPGNGPGSKGNQGGKGQGIAQGPNGKGGNKGGKGQGIAQGPNAKGGKNGPPNINITVINNRTVNIFRGPRRIFVGGVWTTLIAATALTPLVIGSDNFDPDGYVPVAEPVCRGRTAEGCTLNWQSVPTDGGGTNTQCVQYCRRGRTVPVAQPQALTSYAEAPAGCSLVIYAEANFGGQSAPTSENQPDLSSVGWDKAISSIEVQAGSWDFFTVENFDGDSMRLEPGKYGNLDADWNKQISSFMCSQAPK